MDREERQRWSSILGGSFWHRLREGSEDVGEARWGEGEKETYGKMKIFMHAMCSDIFTRFIFGQKNPAFNQIECNLVNKSCLVLFNLVCFEDVNVSNITYRNAV
jgi:hypothetical protein